MKIYIKKNHNSRLLYESLGVTNNEEPLLKLLYFVCLGNSGTAKSLLNLEKFGKYTDNINDDFEYKGYYEMTIPKEVNTLYWLSDKTTFTVYTYMFDTFEDYESRLYENTDETLFNASSKIAGYDSEDRVIGDIRVTIATIYSTKESYVGYSKVFQHDRLLYGLLRHELNHLRRPDDKNRDEVKYNKAYAMLFDFAENAQSNMERNIAQCLYRYCLTDERNAYVDQFYEELDGKSDYRMTDAFSNLKKLTKFINDFPVMKQTSISMQKKFYLITSVLFGISDTDPEKYLNHLLQFIKDNIEKTRRLYLRTTAYPKTYSDLAGKIYRFK